MADTPLDPKSGDLAACVERSVSDAERLRAWVQDLLNESAWWRRQADSKHNARRASDTQSRAALLLRAAERAEACAAKMAGAGKTMADLFAHIDATGPVFDDADAAEAARMRPAPWLACDHGEHTRRGEFELRVGVYLPDEDAWWWRVDWCPVTSRLHMPTAQGTAPTLAAAKAAALAVGGWR